MNKNSHKDKLLDVGKAIESLNAKIIVCKKELEPKGFSAQSCQNDYAISMIQMVENSIEEIDIALSDALIYFESEWKEEEENIKRISNQIKKDKSNFGGHYKLDKAMNLIRTD